MINHTAVSITPQIHIFNEQYFTKNRNTFEFLYHISFHHKKMTFDSLLLNDNLHPKVKENIEHDFGVINMFHNKCSMWTAATHPLLCTKHPKIYWKYEFLIEEINHTAVSITPQIHIFNEQYFTKNGIFLVHLFVSCSKF